MRPNISTRFGSARTMARWVTVVVTALLIGLLAPGCATFEGKITSSKEADTSFFADQTISMLSSADLELERDVTIYTREFFDPNDPDEQRLLELEGKALAVFRVIIEYSLAIVRIANSRASEADQVQMYADWFGPWDDLAFEQLSMDEEAYNNVIAAIRGETDLRKAFLKAQPMLNALNLHMNQVLDEMVKMADVVARNIDARIDAEFADVIRYQEALEEEKYAILSALEDVYRVYSGEKGAYTSLKKNRAIRRKDLLPARVPTDAQTEKIVEHLLNRLEALHLVGQQIEPDWTLYRETHRELDALHQGILNDIKTARLLTLIWVHAHYQMASGKTKPAEWFDIKDVGEAALKLLF